MQSDQFFPQRWQLVVFMVVLVGVLLSCSQNQNEIPRAPVITNHVSSMSPLWERNNYFMGPSEHVRLVASENKLFMIGSASSYELASLIALDAYTGDISWQNNNTSVNVLAASETTLFVGGVGYVYALNPDDGATLWSTSLPLTRTTTKIFVYKNRLYVDTVSNSHFILDAETGKILQKIDYSIDNAPNPNVPIWSNHNMDLEVVEHTTYFQTQPPPPAYKGEIIATDESNGSEIWKSGSLLTISRFAASPLGIFVLDSDGKLLRFEPTDGSREDLVHFTPAPTPSYAPENEAFWVYGYYVAVDAENQLLFVYLGDSAQLFAFHIQ